MAAELQPDQSTTPPRTTSGPYFFPSASLLSAKILLRLRSDTSLITKTKLLLSSLAHCGQHEVGTGSHSSCVLRSCREVHTGGAHSVFVNPTWRTGFTFSLDTDESVHLSSAPHPQNVPCVLLCIMVSNRLGWQKTEPRGRQRDN